MVTNDAVYTADEALARLGRKVSRPTFYKALKDGSIPCLRLGRRVLIPRAAFERLLAGEPVPTEVTTWPPDAA